jgi:hypothetical protein
MASTQKQLFVLVKGNLQGASTKPNSKGKKSQNYPPISKQNFLKYFQKIYTKMSSQNLDSVSMSYLCAKEYASNYHIASGEFFKVYKDWLRIDREKYYTF